MPEQYKSYSLVGGQPVKIDPLTVAEPGTYFAQPDHAYNPIVCNVSGTLEEGGASVTANGEMVLEPSDGKIGFSKVTVTANVPPYLTPLSSPYGAEDGVYICTATASDESTVVGVCEIAEGAVSTSYGDGTFAIDSTGDAPTLTWTPSITAESVTVWFAGSVAE